MDDNPLQPLGLWLNLAQLFYSPFLIFILIKVPIYFVMAYAIIIGAHLFPYGWFYNEKPFAVMAGIILVTSLVVGIYLSAEKMFLIPIFVGIAIGILAVAILVSYQKKVEASQSVTEGRS